VRWEPITPANAVAKLAAACEHAVLDLKVRYDFVRDRTKSFEMVKDVCAFANHLGGTIVVGAQEHTGERKGQIAAFVPLVKPTPGELVKEVDRVIRLYCLPVPIANAVIVELDATQVKAVLGREAGSATIVAINVEPALDTPVGCLACVEHSRACSRGGGQACDCAGNAVPDAWRFPIRAIEGTDLLRPDQIARRMNVIERRALLQLHAVQDEEQILVWFNSGTSFQRRAIPCRVSALDPTMMVFVLELVAIVDAPRAEVPLVFVRAVWRSSGGWNVAIDGSAFDGAGTNREGFRPPGGAVT